MKTVFLVDDDLFVRKGLYQLIDWQQCGYEVCGQADNGEDALREIRKTKPDVVVTDIRMPVIDGLELIKTLHTDQHHIPKFIIISGYNDFTYAQKAMRYGVHDFILKPIDKVEFEQTLHRLAKKINEERKLVTNYLKLEAISVIERFIAGKVEEHVAEKIVTDLHLQHARSFVYILFEVNQVYIEISKNSHNIKKTLEKLINDETLLIWDYGNARFGILLTDMIFGDQGLIPYIQFLQKEVSQSLQKEITIIVGKPVSSLKHIKASYETAKVAEQFKYIYKEHEPIFYEAIKTESVNYVELDQSLYNFFMEQIEEYNTAAIHQGVEEIFQEFYKKRFARDAVKTSINRCTHDLIKTIKQLDGDERRLPSLDLMLQWSDFPYTLWQLKQLFLTFVLECAKEIRRLYQKSQLGSIHKIKKYIETNYRENIKLKEIAKQFYMNPVYIGQLFKKTYGIYFNDYVLKVRIKEAKKILRQTDLRVYEVADLVGFLNADYFVTQFEKMTGMTPTQYRKRIVANQLGEKDEAISHK